MDRVIPVMDVATVTAHLVDIEVFMATTTTKRCIFTKEVVCLHVLPDTIETTRRVCASLVARTALSALQRVSSALLVNGVTFCQR